MRRGEQLQFLEHNGAMSILVVLLYAFSFVFFVLAGLGYRSTPEVPFGNRLVCFGLACFVAAEAIPHIAGFPAH